MPRGRPRKPKQLHPCVLMVNKRLKELGITKTDFSCQLLELMGSDKPCTRSWHSNVMRFLGGGGKNIVSPGPKIRTAIYRWLELHPSTEK